MQTYSIHIQQEEMLGDIITPVQLYLKLRDSYPHSLLLESSDYHSINNSYSFLCLHPIATFTCVKNEVTIELPDGKIEKFIISPENLISVFDDFKNRFQFSGNPHPKCNGLFGYVTWDAIPYFENIHFSSDGNKATIPEFKFSLFQNIIVFNHYHNAIVFLEYENKFSTSKLTEIKNTIKKYDFPIYPFKKQGEVVSNLTDEAFIDQVKKGKNACFRGDVFQIVPSRQFSQPFKGDDFNVYRALRSINPSPYLFYFDYGGYKIFGSSPESQLIIQNNQAEIDPIAGTFKRTGDINKDLALAEELKLDKKENAEHVMLVDLARNDLSRNSTEVFVDKYKEIQFFSHVIHMVSKVKAKLQDQTKVSSKILADTFPAGTLSGAPKYKAMQLIDEMENQNRGIYGGAIGYIGFNGDINLAILIRSFLSKENSLYYQAGAGVVSESDEMSELQEVNNKLAALNKAILMAENI
jgi:anthranilate synthase component I